VPSAARTEPVSADEVPMGLRQEMDQALDSTRSMFSDVDRFITLGRIENAISLLEFQVRREPDDRDSWIKLMAVYRQEGKDDDFERTLAAYREQFGNS
jgi:DNA-binding SARP family transcriptional activator